MPSDIDDGVIGDADGLLRRIRPDQIVEDKNRGELRPSSGAFTNTDLSVDSERILGEEGLDWTFSLNGYEGYSLVRFVAGVARGLQLAVVHAPLSENRAHVEVRGKKTNGTAKKLRDHSEWVFLA